MGDVPILQMDRGRGKTTELVQVVAQLHALGEPVLAVVADHQRVRFLRQALSDAGVRTSERALLRGRQVLVLTERTLGHSLRGLPLDTSLVADDVNDWDHGVHHPALSSGVFHVALVTSSPHPVGVLELLGRLASDQERARRAKAQSQARQERQLHDELMVHQMVRYIDGGPPVRPIPGNHPRTT